VSRHRRQQRKRRGRWVLHVTVDLFGRHVGEWGQFDCWRHGERWFRNVFAARNVPQKEGLFR
jgi:hypothetical protein